MAPSNEGSIHVEHWKKVYPLRSVVPLSRQNHWQKVLLETFYQQKFHYYCLCCWYLIIDFSIKANIIDKPVSRSQFHISNSQSFPSNQDQDANCQRVRRFKVAFRHSTLVSSEVETWWLRPFILHMPLEFLAHVD